MHTWDFLDEFVADLKAKLQNDEIRWGDTWLKRTKRGQDERMIASTNDRFDRYTNAGMPIDYLAIIGDAYINWVREKHPEMWSK